ncbi:MAG: hypothetical protein GYA57_09330 [Myxococcales bacterium]|nr:hypothetical protein [Myxococcales bacterium]
MVRIAVLELVFSLTAVWNCAAQGNLIGFWGFDQGAAADSSGKGNHGRIVGAPVVTDGAAGKALEFNGGTDYVDLQRNLFNGLSEFTIALYRKPYAWGYKVSLAG